jgi:hypothetical protein
VSKVFIREKYTLKNVLIISVLILLIAVLIAHAVYEDNETKRGIEIINHWSFVGEVVERESKKRNNMFPMYGYTMFYYMYIIGEYLSNEDEVIHVDRMFRVNEEIYNRYEVGDIISNK